MAAMLAQLSFAATPVAVSIGDVLPENADVYGLHLSLFGAAAENVTGMSLGVINTGIVDEMRGVHIGGLVAAGAPRGPERCYAMGLQAAGFLAGDDIVSGLQIGGVFAMAEELTGLSIGGLVSMTRKGRGVQVGSLLASSEDHCGVQIACYNATSAMCGVQIGILNFAIPAKDGWVVQIGLVNGIAYDEKYTWFTGIRYLPLVNVGW